MLKQALALLAMLFLCTACSKLDKQFGSYKPDRNAGYLKQAEAPPLKLPAGYELDAKLSGDRFPLPEGPRPAPGTEPISIVPPTLLKTVEETDENATS